MQGIMGARGEVKGEIERGGGEGERASLKGRRRGRPSQRLNSFGSAAARPVQQAGWAARSGPALR